MGACLNVLANLLATNESLKRTVKLVGTGNHFSANDCEDIFVHFFDKIRLRK